MILHLEDLLELDAFNLSLLKGTGLTGNQKI